MFVPWLSVHETCGWACHVAAHNSDLGDDFAIAVGYAIPAPFNGKVTHQIRAEAAPYKALYIVFIQSDDDPSLVFEFMHLSQFVPDGHYLMKQTIGYSGGAHLAMGAGRSTGPHLHANAKVSGKLTPVRDALSEFAGVGPVTPVTDTSMEEDMSFSIVHLANSAPDETDVVSLITGHRMAIASSYHMGLLQRLKVNDGADPMLAGEIDICKAYLMTINPATLSGTVDLTPVLTATAALDAQEDDYEVKLLAALATVSGTLSKMVPAAPIDYAALAKAVNDDAAKRLAS